VQQLTTRARSGKLILMTGTIEEARRMLAHLVPLLGVTPETFERARSQPLFQKWCSIHEQASIALMEYKDALARLEEAAAPISRSQSP
jgi:hypothetical protein